MSDPVKEHKSYAPKSLGVAVFTISDSRTPDTDDTGNLIAQKLQSAGHKVVQRSILPDNLVGIKGDLVLALNTPAVDAIICNGGTGVSPRDVTPEAVSQLAEKTLPGFGELFRSLSYAEIGPAAYLSRALCAVVKHKPVYALPGSPAAAALAMDKLLLPELPHLAGQLRRK